MSIAMPSMFDKAIAVSRKAVEANPKDRDLKLMLAGELVDQGKDDEGIDMAKGLLTNSCQRPEDLDCPGTNLHPPSQMERCRRSSQQGHDCHIQEGR